MGNTRIDIEYSIISTCMCMDGAYERIANVLSCKNFKTYNAREIWRCFELIYPMPINHCTVWLMSKKIHDYNNRVVVIGPYISYNNLDRLLYHAFLLLEMDIKDKFEDLLFKCYESSKIELEKAAIADCLSVIRNNEHPDLLESVYGIKDYLVSLNTSETTVNSICDFIDNLNVKVLEIKKVSQVELLLNKLIEIGSYSWTKHNKNAAETLSECLAICFVGKPLSETHIKQIEALKNQLLTA